MPTTEPVQASKRHFPDSFLPSDINIIITHHNKFTFMCDKERKELTRIKEEDIYGVTLQKNSTRQHADVMRLN